MCKIISHETRPANGAMDIAQQETTVKISYGAGDDFWELYMWREHDLELQMNFYRGDGPEGGNITREQAAIIWPIIKKFAETGELPES